MLENRKHILLFVCFLSLFLFLYAFLSPKEYFKLSRAADEEQNQSPPEEFTYDAKGARNPFIPLITSDGRLLKLKEQKSEGGLVLEGVICDKEGISYAIVNGEVVKSGDKIGDYQLLKIEEKRIILFKDDEFIEVKLKEESNDD